MTLSPFVYVLVALGVAALGIGRALLDGRSGWRQLFHYWGRAEIAAITALLFLLTGIGFLQIILRNFFNTGILWADPVMRHLVLWLGCTGAAYATAHCRHINIDVLGRILPDRFQPARRVVVHGATALASTILCISALRLVIDERAFGDIAFFGVKTWVAQAILPITFFAVAARSITNVLINRETPHADVETEAESP